MPVNGCNNPDLHPELAAFQSLVESLRDQPRSSVQMRYKVDDDIAVMSKSSIRLWFWPIAPYEKGRFKVTPSPGLKVLGASDVMDVPYKGMAEIELLALRPGHHHLLVETLIEIRGEEKRHLYALAVPVALGEADALASKAPSGTGFAGPKMQKAIAGHPRAAKSAKAQAAED